MWARVSWCGDYFFDGSSRSPGSGAPGAARHGVLVAQIDQRPAVPLLEEQIAREVRSVAVHCADAPQEKAHRPWQLVYVANDHALDGLAGRDHQHFDLPQRQPRFPELLGSDEADGAVDSLHG